MNKKTPRDKRGFKALKVPKGLTNLNLGGT